MTSELPSNWEYWRLGDVGAWYGGGTPASGEAAYWDGDIPWVSPKDMKALRLTTSIDKITPEAIENSAAKLIPSGAVLFVTRSGILAHSFPVAVSDVAVTVNQDIKAIKPVDVIDPVYLAWALRAAGRKILSSCSKHGTTVHSIEMPSLKELPIPIPPEPEQRRIVAKIEELFSELDKGVESLTAAREQLKAYRQSILRAAFEGKLTQGWRAKHLERVDGAADLEASLKAAGALNAKRIPAPELQEVTSLPKEWAYFRVASLCSVVRGGSPRPAGDTKYYDGHIPFLKVADLTHATGMYLSAHTSTIKEAGLSKTRMTPPNTLLISNSGATLGVPKICTFETTFNDGVAAFLGVPQGYLEYFYYFWESKTAQLRGIDQGAAQPNLNTSILGDTPIPICSRDEAKALVELLKALLSNIERQSDEIDRNLAQAAALRQSILKRAFSGQLVAQDAADEPASALLERIRAEREGSGATKRRNNKNSKKEAA